MPLPFLSFNATGSQLKKNATMTDAESGECNNEDDTPSAMTRSLPNGIDRNKSISNEIVNDKSVVDDGLTTKTHGSTKLTYKLSRRLSSIMSRLDGKKISAGLRSSGDGDLERCRRRTSAGDKKTNSNKRQQFMQNFIDKYFRLRPAKWIIQQNKSDLIDTSHEYTKKELENVQREQAGFENFLDKAPPLRRVKSQVEENRSSHNVCIPDYKSLTLRGALDVARVAFYRNARPSILQSNDEGMYEVYISTKDQSTGVGNQSITSQPKDELSLVWASAPPCDHSVPFQSQNSTTKVDEADISLLHQSMPTSSDANMVLDSPTVAVAEQSLLNRSMPTCDRNVLFDSADYVDHKPNNRRGDVATELLRSPCLNNKITNSDPYVLHSNQLYRECKAKGDAGIASYLPFFHPYEYNEQTSEQLIKESPSSGLHRRSGTSGHHRRRESLVPRRLTMLLSKRPQHHHHTINSYRLYKKEKLQIKTDENEKNKFGLTSLHHWLHRGSKNVHSSLRRRPARLSFIIYEHETLLFDRVLYNYHLNNQLVNQVPYTPIPSEYEYELENGSSIAYHNKL